MTTKSPNIRPIITIDGPSASGKGTIAQQVAKKLGFHYLDSGALYRIVAYATKKNDIAWNDAQAVTACAKSLNITFNNEQVLLDHQDISDEIRTEEISKGASEVAIHAPLRKALLVLQHRFDQPPGLVADGRDMGTVVFKNATLKIFLTASTEVRAKRRYTQLLAKKLPANYQNILKDLQERDSRDQNRTNAPLVKAVDAILLDTDNLSITDTINAVLQHFQQKNCK